MRRMVLTLMTLMISMIAIAGSTVTTSTGPNTAWVPVVKSVFRAMLSLHGYLPF